MPRRAAGTTTARRTPTAKQQAAWQKQRDDAAASKAALLAEQEAAEPDAPTAAFAAAPNDFISANDLFGTAAALFTKAGQAGGLTRAETAQLETLLGRIDPLAHPELAENPAVQGFLTRMEARTAANSEIPPGSIVGTGLAEHKKAWTHQDVLKRLVPWIEGPNGPQWANRNPDFEPVTWTPRETVPLIWNGLMIVVEQDQEATAPRCFKLIYDERIRALNSATQHAQLMYGQRTAIDPRTADPSIVGPSTGHVRSFGRGVPISIGAVEMPDEGVA